MPKLSELFPQICDFVKRQVERKTGGIPDDSVRAAVKQLREFGEILGRKVNLPNGWKVQIGEGVGRFPLIPWVAFIESGLKISNGVYVAICFGRAGNGAVVGLIQSTSNPQGLTTTIRKRRGMTPSINVDGTQAMTHYNNCFANPLEIFKDSFDEEALVKHLKDSIDLCLEFLNKSAGKADAGGAPSGDPFAATDFVVRCGRAGLRFENEMVLRFVAALMAKPFVILTGLSGSGKTKLAQAFARWLVPEGQRRLVPVGADWTNPEHLIGYPSALDPAEYVLPETGVLKLLLEASTHPEKPYVLILDEMNLSHVERYFADFLSAMESGERIMLYQGAARKAGGDDIPPTVQFPRNLFVVGTVNVDETTYMFSPKVLDRAQVIEFRVTPDEMNDFLNTGPEARIDLSAFDGADPRIAAAFAAEATADRVTPEGWREEIGRALQTCFPELQAVGAEFGFRTAADIWRYIAFHHRLAPALAPDAGTPEAAIDAAILQKLLPKLHGSKRKLKPALDKLLRICLRPEALPADPDEPLEDANLVEANARYPRAFEKLRRMRQRLLENGFTSFIEA